MTLTVQEPIGLFTGKPAGTRAHTHCTSACNKSRLLATHKSEASLRLGFTAVPVASANPLTSGDARLWSGRLRAGTSTRSFLISVSPEEAQGQHRASTAHLGRRHITPGAVRIIPLSTGIKICAADFCTALWPSVRAFALCYLSVPSMAAGRGIRTARELNAASRPLARLHARAASSSAHPPIHSGPQSPTSTAGPAAVRGVEAGMTSFRPAGFRLPRLNTGQVDSRLERSRQSRLASRMPSIHGLHHDHVGCQPGSVSHASTSKSIP